MIFRKNGLGTALREAMRKMHLHMFLFVMAFSFMLIALFGKDARTTTANIVWALSYLWTLIEEAFAFYFYLEARKVNKLIARTAALKARREEKPTQEA